MQIPFGMCFQKGICIIHTIQVLHVSYMLSVVYRATYYVKQLVCNSLLSLLVVLKIQFPEQLVSIVCSCLHSHHAGSVLRCVTVKESCVKHQVRKFRNQF